jgi:hypothetical protein
MLLGPMLEMRALELPFFVQPRVFCLSQILRTGGHIRFIVPLYPISLASCLRSVLAVTFHKQWKLMRERVSQVPQHLPH